MTNLPNYDSWKTHNPSEEELHHHEDLHNPEAEPAPDWENVAGCTCSFSFKFRRNCPVHGIDPDNARDSQIDHDRFERDY